MYHRFHIELAIKYGVEKALIIQYFDEQLIGNEAKAHNGSLWISNSAETLSNIFTYMNRQKISRLLRQMEDENIIKSGNFNKSKYDRTKWYTFTDKFISENSSRISYKKENAYSWIIIEYTSKAGVKNEHLQTIIKSRKLYGTISSTYERNRW